MDYRALIVRKSGENKFTYKIEDVNLNELRANDVTIRVHYSSINYKDCLSCQGNLGVTRRFPHTPGIDAAGIIVSSNVQALKVGDKVIVLSHDLGMNTSGGFGQYIRVPEKWVMRLPKNMSLFESMSIGTAGYTAALAVQVLKENIKEIDSGEIIVTGGTGGIGSVSTYLLSQLGYKVTVITGKESAKKYLECLGASTVIDRDEFLNLTNRNLLPEKQIGAIDVAGGTSLTTLIRTCVTGGTIVSTGMVESPEFSLTVLPFILRGIHLVGVNADSSYLSREQTWFELSHLINKFDYKLWTNSINIEELPRAIKQVTKGQHLGRFVVDMRDGDTL